MLVSVDRFPNFLMAALLTQSHPSYVATEGSVLVAVQASVLDDTPAFLGKPVGHQVSYQRVFGRRAMHILESPCRVAS